MTAVKPKAKGKQKPSTMVNDSLTYLEERQDWGSAVLYVCPPNVSVLTDEDNGDEEHVDGSAEPEPVRSRVRTRSE